MAVPKQKNRLRDLSAGLSNLGLTYGVALAALSAAFILFLLLGGRLQKMPLMDAADRTYMLNALHYAVIVLQWSGIAVALGLVIRYFYAEAVGLIMTAGGLLVCFGVPQLLGPVAGSLSGEAATAANKAMGALCRLGVIFFLPGVWMVLCSILLRVLSSLSGRDLVRVPGKRQENERRLARLKPLNPCWETVHCRLAVRDDCPAFIKRKSCWRLKSGCMCDERIFLKSLASKAPANEHQRAFMESLGLTNQTDKLSASIKRARCRRCAIYAEHQRQKYGLLVPVWLLGLAVAGYSYYDQITAWIRPGVLGVERLLSFVTTSTVRIDAGDAGIEFMTGFLSVCAVILVAGYGLRALEYLIFELQV